MVSVNGQGEAYRISHNVSYWNVPEFREAAGGDGYDRIAAAERHGWNVRAAWGEDGWDLGSWPLVQVFTRDRPPSGFMVSSRDLRDSLAARDHVGYWLAVDVEGDITTWRFPTPELRAEEITRQAWWWWHQEEQPFVAGLDRDGPIPERFCGPYKRKPAAPAEEVTA